MKLPMLVVAGMTICAPSYAYVLLAQREAPAGSTYKAVLQVPHGCDGAATTAIRVTLPEAIVIVRPEPKPGWNMAVEHEALPSPILTDGHRQTDRVSSVVWQGGPLPDGQLNEFTLMVRLPADPGQVSFPVIQSCSGKQVRWMEEPASERGETPPAHPAPSLRLTRSK